MKILACLFILMTTPAMADFVKVPARGFHWYSSEAQEKRLKPPPKPKRSALTRTPYEQLMEVRKATLNKLASALIDTLI